ncbi:MAG: deoxyribodipyrimidine photo-lyase, partial [Woeseiaceae bacterium]
MTDTTTAIVWFRRDLRLADNPALHAAINDYDQIIALYIDDRGDDGDWRQGAASDWWLHHSLAALSESIEKRGGALVVRQGNAADVLDTLIKSQDIDAIYWNRLYDPAAIKRDKAIKQSLTEREITAKSFNGALLIEPWEVETQTETPYRVFTPFWREAQKRLNLGDRLPTPKKIKSPKVDSATLKSLDLLPSIRWDKGIEAAWVPGEAAAAEKAAEFIKDGAQHYDEQRDFPGIEGVSRLSPHLHFGEISVRQLWEDIVDEHGRTDDGSTIYRSELGWREFSHHILYHYPHTADEPMKEKYAAFPWRDNADD